MALYFVVQSFSNGAGGLSPDDLPEEVAEMERV